MSLAHLPYGECERPEPARYDLSETELNSLTSQLLVEKQPSPEHRLVCYRLEQDDPYANVARTIEREVFEKYFGNDTDQMKGEYGDYESQSEFFLSIDQKTGRPAGALRVIKNGPAGLKTLNDLDVITYSGKPDMPQLPMDLVRATYDIDDLDTCWDIATVVKRKEYRSDHDVSLQLYRGMYVAAMQENVEHFVSIIDSKPYEMMVKLLGISFEPMMGSKPFSYLGSKLSQAVYGEAPTFVEKMKRNRYKSLKRIMARQAMRQLAYGSKDNALYL